MKKLVVVTLTMAMMAFFGYKNTVEAQLDAQQAKIEQLSASNAAYFEGMNGLKDEAERLERINEHYASIMTAR